MCAIAGFLSIYKALPENSSELILKMLKSMQHRGPDGFGSEIDFERQVAFGQARLAIIAPTEEGKQPFFSKDKTIISVFNGEIYNYKELRKELKSLGHRFLTATDTEVLVVAYLEWGESFVEKLEGMFAIALLDKNANIFFLIRDRIGTKPIYFAEQNGMLTFASEVRAITTLPWIKAELDTHAIYDFLTFMSVPAPRSMLQKIYKLPAGYMLKMNAQKNIDFKQWYCPIQGVAAQQKITKFMTIPEVIVHLTGLLSQCIKMRLVSDVPVAIFLSGGLDSSLITALAAQHGKTPATFNISFKDDKNSDEKYWARRVAKIFGAEHHEIEITPNETEALISQMFNTIDQPLADCVNVPLLKISQVCRAKNFKVVLVGEGADELFFGYPTYAKQKSIANFFNNPLINNLPSCIFKLGFEFSKKFGLKNSLTSILHNKSLNQELFWGNAIAFAEYEKQNIEAFFSASNLCEDQIIRQIFPQFNQKIGSQNLINFFSKKIQETFPLNDFSQKIALLELKHRIPDLLLARVDAMTMAAGLEGREPFLDHKLIEFVLALPPALRLGNGKELKFLLKQVALKFLPKDLVLRPKVGFGAPVKNWAAQKLLEPMQKIATKPFNKLLPEAKQHSVKQWTLHCLEKYLTKF